MKKKEKSVFKFYRECFYKHMGSLSYKGREPVSRLEKLLAYLSLRSKKLKILGRLLKENKNLADANPYLLNSLYKCKLPIYLAVNSLKIGVRKPVYCSKSRLCAYCWIRTACKSFSKTVKRIEPMDDYVYAYHETISFKPIDSSEEELKNAGLGMFSKRHKYSKASLISKKINGISEQLCVYPAVLDDGSKVFVLELRKLAYCHKESSFAKGSICTSPNKFSEPSISYCAYPAKIMNSSVKNNLKIDAAFKNSRLLRQYGVMYRSAKSGDVSTGVENE